MAFIRWVVVTVGVPILVVGCSSGSLHEGCGPRPSDAVFNVGEVWTYRNSEPNATFTVNCVEAFDGGGNVAHVAALPAVSLPISEQSLLTDRLSLVSSDGPIDEGWVEAHQIWNDEGGGVFTIPLSEVMQIVNGGAGASK